MLLNGFACAIFVGVECHKALGLCTILKTVYNDVAYNILIVNLWLKIFCQFGEECELLKVNDKFIDASCAFVVVDILEQLLEHACCCARCGYKF